MAQGLRLKTNSTPSSGSSYEPQGDIEPIEQLLAQQQQQTFPRPQARMVDNNGKTLDGE